MLINLVKKCLIQANKNKMASIAFSSIGTGTLQFPLDVVARVYFDQAVEFSKKHPSTTLKDIRFVPFDKDIQIVRAFAAELSKRTPQKESSIFSAVKERTADHLELDVGPLCFQVQAGDITNETTDAIVVVTNSELNLSVGGGAGAAILRAGGDSIQYECSVRGTQLPGSVVVTRAGRLRAKSIFHIVRPQTMTTNSLEAVVTKCLQVADRNGITSISFPAIGTGNLGMDAKECAEVLLASVAKFSQQRPKSIQLIRITIFQPSMIKAFRSVMKIKSREKERSEPGIFAQLANLPFGRKEEEETNPNELPASYSPAKMSLEVFAGSRADLGGGIKAINNMMNEHCKRQVIENDTIMELSEGQVRRIHTAELRYDTEVKIEKKVGRIQIRGNSEDILAVSGQIHDVLHKVKEEERERDRAEMLAKEVEWEFEDSGIFEKFPSDINADIEMAYVEKKLVVPIGEGKFTIDFVNMTIKGPGGNVTDVRRRDLKKGKTSNDSPSHTKLLRLVET